MRFSISILILFFAVNFNIHSQIAINTSFEQVDGYSIGAVKGVNKWTGNGDIIDIAADAKTGSQSLQLTSTATALLSEFIAYDKITTGLTNDVYLDIWLKVKALNGQFIISSYDLTPNSSAKRALEVILTSTGKLKIYSGSTGTEDAVYVIGEWLRFSAKIDYSASTYQVAVNGVFIDKTYNFRESYIPASLGRTNGNKEFHSLRFSNGTATNNLIFDDITIGTNPISDIEFGQPNFKRTITVTQPENGSISLSPLKEYYELNEEVAATISVPNHYIFTGWNGDLNGSENPKSFVVTKNMAIGANVRVDQANPPPSYSITLIEPTGGTIHLEPQQATYYEGTKVKATLTTSIGYEFKNWTADFSGNTNPFTFSIKKNTTIGADVVEKTEQGGVKNVNTVAAFKSALQGMIPGDEIIVADGDYNLGGISLKNLGGTPSKPIIIRAENIGKARIIGKSSFTLQACENIILQGFNFDIDFVSTIIKLEGSSFIRITQNEFRMTSNETLSSKWIIFGEVWENAICRSKHNRLDHNLFDGKIDGGAWVVIDGSHGANPDISKFDKIDFNHFRNNKPRVTNEKETIRVGVSDLSMLSSFTIVEYNLFEECDGDPEIVSVKSCDNTIQRNTFLKSLGTLSLRHGFRNRVEGNYFLGEGKTDENGNGCGGIRVYGLDHVIINNYFEGLTGSKWDAAITITNGDVLNNSSSLTSHFIPENIIFAHNTLVNNVSDIEIGFDNNNKYNRFPKNCQIVNNIIVNDKNPIIKSYSESALNGVGFVNNIMHSTGTSTIGIDYNESQIRMVDPKLEKTNKRVPGNIFFSTPFEVYKITSESPALNASVELNTAITVDMEGQLRLPPVNDIGADEFNTESQISYGFLSSNQTGINGTIENYESPYTKNHNTDFEKVKIFPNPAYDFLIIENSSTIKQVKIQQVTGKLMLKTNYSKIDLSDFTPGIYFISIEFEDGKVASSGFIKK